MISTEKRSDIHMNEHEKKEMNKKNKINKIHIDRIKNQTNHTLESIITFYRFILLRNYHSITLYYTVLHCITPYSPLEPLVAPSNERYPESNNKFTLRIL